ncbi:MAG: hypothetical protein GY915_01165, partial [bacterium]|nr:hypothetical protein [bacterium]
MLSKFSFWKTREELNEELDYRFVLFYDPNLDVAPTATVYGNNFGRSTNNQTPESIEVVEEPSDEVIKEVVEEIIPRTVITQEDIQEDVNLKELLLVLDLANNPRITWIILRTQYALMQSWKTGEEVD